MPDLTTILSILGAGGAGIWGLWAFVKNKAPVAADLVEEIVSKLNDAKPVPNAAPGRLEALEKAESLLQFFESKGNTAGADAIQVVVKEILASKA